MPNVNHRPDRRSNVTSTRHFVERSVVYELSILLLIDGRRQKYRYGFYPRVFWAYDQYRTVAVNVLPFDFFIFVIYLLLQFYTQGQKRRFKTIYLYLLSGFCIRTRLRYPKSSE